MPISFKNARARVVRVPTIAFALSLFAVLLAPLSAFAAAPKISGTPTDDCEGRRLVQLHRDDFRCRRRRAHVLDPEPARVGWSSTRRSASCRTSRPAPNVGTYSNIIISVSDGKGGDRIARAVLDHRERSGTTNQPPTISGTPPTTAKPGVWYNFSRDHIRSQRRPAQVLDPEPARAGWSSTGRCASCRPRRPPPTSAPIRTSSSA